MTGLIIGEGEANLQRIVVADTGPLLSAAAMPRAMGFALLHERKGRLVVPIVVQDELNNLARREKSGPANQAARRMASKGPFGLLEVDGTVFGSKERARVKADIRARETERTKGRHLTPKLGGHDGEVDAILLALQRGAILITNDLAALEVAQTEGLEAVTFGGLLSAAINSERLMADEVSKACEGIDRREIDLGVVNTDALSLGSIPYPPEL